jgi:hypothetical protein
MLMHGCIAILKQCVINGSRDETVSITCTLS